MRPLPSALLLLLLGALAGATRGAFPLIGGARASGFELAMAERFAESGCVLANQSKNVSLFKDAWLFFYFVSVSIVNILQHTEESARHECLPPPLCLSHAKSARLHHRRPGSHSCSPTRRAAATRRRSKR